jgi:hypothetical protein
MNNEELYSNITLSTNSGVFIRDPTRVFKYLPIEIGERDHLGIGIVTDINLDLLYPVEVRFDRHTINFTLGGEYLLEDNFHSIIKHT